MLDLQAELAQMQEEHDATMEKKERQLDALSQAKKQAAKDRQEAQKIHGIKDRQIIDRDNMVDQLQTELSLQQLDIDDKILEYEGKCQALEQQLLNHQESARQTLATKCQALEQQLRAEQELAQQTQEGLQNIIRSQAKELREQAKHIEKLQSTLAKPGRS